MTDRSVNPGKRYASRLTADRQRLRPAFVVEADIWLGVLFPKEAQAACYRQRRDRRENRTARVGVHSFKEPLGCPSHNTASQIF
jgi:hypothetical protein